MTLNEINREIQAKAPHVTLYRGKGYLYYIFDDVARNVHESHSVYVPYIYMQPSARWIREGIEFSEKTEGEIAERGQFGERFRAISAFAPMGAPRADAVSDAMSDQMGGIIANMLRQRETY